jgi:hypothetical protein
MKNWPSGQVGGSDLSGLSSASIAPDDEGRWRLPVSRKMDCRGLCLGVFNAIRLSDTSQQRRLTPIPRLPAPTSGCFRVIATAEDAGCFQEVFSVMMTGGTGRECRTLKAT